MSAVSDAQADFPDDTGTSEAQLAPGPPEYLRQLNKFTNILLGSSTVALVRTLMMPNRSQGAPPPPPPGAGPSWFRNEWKQQVSGRGAGGRFLRDTAAFTAACYIMDGGEALMKLLRGDVEDVLNKMVGGGAAGIFLGSLWYGLHRPGPTAILVFGGSLAGYTSFNTEKMALKVLLEKQGELEKDVLHKSPDDLRPQLDTHYLRQLMVLKQQQMAKKFQAEAASRQADGGAGADGSPAPTSPQRSWNRGFAASSLPPLSSSSSSSSSPRKPDDHRAIVGSTSDGSGPSDGDFGDSGSSDSFIYDQPSSSDRGRGGAGASRARGGGSDTSGGSLSQLTERGGARAGQDVWGDMTPAGQRDAGRFDVNDDWAVINEVPTNELK